MQFSLDQDESLILVRGYENGQLRFRNETVSENVIVTPQKIVPWGATTCDALLQEHIDEILSLGPELVLLGSGFRLSFPAQSLMVSALSRGIGFETMDTAAACRTYNILAMEGRNVAAALLLN